jgi:hypothetical protein
MQPFLGRSVDQSMGAIRTVLLLLMVALPARAESLWLHLEVTPEPAGEKRVSVNLPLRAVTRAIAVLPTDACRSRCQTRFGDADLRMTDVRTIVRSLQQWPNGAVGLRRDGTLLHFRREGENLLVRFEPLSDLPGEVRIPFGLMEAVVSGSRDSANLRAAAVFLEQRGDGELMVVDREGTVVRMWVDGDAAGRRSW